MKTRYHIRQLNARAGNLTWYGEISTGKTRKRINLGTKIQAEAEAWKHKMDALEYLPEDLKREISVSSSGRTEAAPAPSAMLARYRSELARVHRESRHTQVAYEQRLNRLVGLLHNEARVRDITKEKCRSWVHGLSETLSPRTVQETVKCSRAFWRWMIDLGWASDNPLLNIQLPRRRKKERPFWTASEVNAIIADAPDPETRAFWGCMAFAGLRHNEAAALTWDRVSESCLRVFGKGAEEAEVPMAKKLWALLVEIQKGSDVGPCFPGLPKYEASRLRILRRCCAGRTFAVTGPITFHRFRHSFGSNLLRAGVGIKTVQQLLRHKSIKITLDVYAHLIPSDFVGVVDRL